MSAGLPPAVSPAISRMQAVPQFGGRRNQKSEGPDYGALPPADTVRLLRAWMYTDLTQRPQPRFKQHIDEPRWVALYHGMLETLLGDTDAQSQPNTHAMLKDMMQPVNRMHRALRKNRDFMYKSHQEYHRLRREAIDNLDKLNELLLVLDLQDPAVRKKALEETVTRRLADKPRLWYLA